MKRHVSTLSFSIKFLILKRIKLQISKEIRAVNFAVYSAFLRHASIYAAFLCAAEYSAGDSETKLCFALCEKIGLCRLWWSFCRGRAHQRHTTRRWCCFHSGILISMSREKCILTTHVCATIVETWRPSFRSAETFHRPYHFHRKFFLCAEIRRG